MIKSLLIILVISIVLIIGIVFVIRYAIKNSEKEYKGANIISFLFPPVGLIIYAINIGKNDKLAKSCVKCAITGICTGLMIFFLTKTILYVAYSSNTIHSAKRINTIEPKKDDTIKIKYDSLESLKEELLKDNFITNCEYETKGKNITINIEYKENGFYDTKSTINSIIKKYNLDGNYSYIINVNSKYYGYYSGFVNDNIVWSEDE